MRRKRLSYVAVAIFAMATVGMTQSRFSDNPMWRPDGRLVSPGALQQTKAGAPSSPQDVSFTFSTVDYPRVDARQGARGINDQGRIVGFYLTPAGTQGYLLQGTKFTPINYPNAITTFLWGISKSSTIVGHYQDASSNYHGFTLKHGVFTTVDYPSAANTQVTGMNAHGVMVGAYWQTTPNFHGFMLNAGVFSPIDFPSAVLTRVFGINGSGEIVGSYEAADATFHGFTYQNGVYTTLDFPGAGQTNLQSINDRGDMTGSYSTDSGATYHGFLYKDGTFTTFDVPYLSDLTSSHGSGINNKGQIVGSYTNAAGYHWGFLAQYQ